MMLVTGALLLTPYTLILWFGGKRDIKTLFLIGGSAVLGLLLSGYYVIPLLVEIKYFYYGVGDKLRSTEFLSVEQLLSPFAPYFGSAAGPPGEALRLRVIEAFGIGAAIVSLCLTLQKRQWFFVSILVTSVALAALTLPACLPLFELITFFNNLQYPLS